MRGLLCAAYRGRHDRPASSTLPGSSLDTEAASSTAASLAGVLKPAETSPAPAAATLATLPREVLLRVAVLAAVPLSAW